jgi:hypothetical protein
MWGGRVNHTSNTGAVGTIIMTIMTIIRYIVCFCLAVVCHKQTGPGRLLVNRMGYGLADADEQKRGNALSAWCTLTPPGPWDATSEPGVAKIDVMLHIYNGSQLLRMFGSCQNK